MFTFDQSASCDKTRFIVFVVSYYKRDLIVTYKKPNLINTSQLILNPFNNDSEMKENKCIAKDVDLQGVE